MGKTATEVLEDQYLQEAARQLADDIDFQVLSDMLCDTGWIKVVLDTLGSNRRAIDMNEWMHNECKGHWKHRGRTWVFEYKEDAALFRLTWS